MSTSSSESRSGLVLELAEEFLDRYRAGERPALKEYIDRHPDLAAEIREVFPAMAMMENIALADETIDADHLTSVTIPQLEQLGDYRVLREVGRGGMGVVYEAEQVSLGRHVALKVLPPHSLRDVKQRRRFEREAKAAARLHHTNIVPVFGVGEQEETPYYVMQFIQGQGLDAVLEELKRLRSVPRPNAQGAGGAGESTAGYSSIRRDVSAADVARSLLTGRFEPAGDPAEKPPVVSATETGPDALSSSSLSLPAGAPRGKSKRQTYWEGVARIGHQVADALAYAHGQGIVHRDVKPSNLLLDTKGTVWVADFGLAKAQDQQDLTNSGDILGTLRYMPPEAFGGKTDARGDIYSLGLTLYEMLAFRPAFDERDRGRLVQQVTHEAPPPLKKVNVEVPRDLETIIQKAIEHDPNHRYASASELADDLRRFVDDEPIHARRASIAERVARWGRRNPAVASLAAAVAILVSTVIGGLWYNSIAARRALIVQTRLRDEAEEQRHQAELAAARESDQKAIAIAAREKAESANQALLSSQESLRATLYAAQMNLVKVAWNSDSPSRALDLLAATVPRPGEPDPRGFEWHYWRKKLHGERSVRKFPGPNQASVHPVFSPDGSLAAILEETTGQSWSGRIVVYETATGRLHQRIPIPSISPGPLIAFAISTAFSGDGKMVAICFGHTLETGTLWPFADRDWQIRTIVWHLTDRRVVLDNSEKMKASMVFLRVSLNGNGSRLASGWQSFDRGPTGIPEHFGAFRVLDVTAGREYLHETSRTEGVWSVELSSDGRLVATAHRARTGRATADMTTRLTIRDVDSGRVRYELAAQEDLTMDMRFSPDCHFFATTVRNVSDQGNLMVIDIEKGREVIKEPLPGPLAAARLTFSPDGRSLVVAGAEGPQAQVRDAATGRLLHELSLGVSGADQLVVRRSDGRLLTFDSALTFNGEDLREWELPAASPGSLDAGLVIPNIAGFFSNRNRQFGLAQGGRRLIVSQSDRDQNKQGKVAVHDVVTGSLLQEFDPHEAGAVSERNWKVSSIHANASGTKLAGVIGNLSNPDDTTYRLRVWDLTNGHPLLTLDHERLGGALSTSATASIQAWNDAGTRLAVSTRQIVLAPDGKVVSRGAWSLVVVEVPSGRIVRTFATGSSPGVASFEPDRGLVAIGSTAPAPVGWVTKIDLVEPVTGQVVRQLKGDLPSLGQLVFSADGRRLAAATARVGSLGNLRRGRILVWDLTRPPLSEPVRIEDAAVDVLTFTADGRRLAAASASLRANEVRLWDTATARDLATWSIPGGMAHDLAFDSQGHQLRVAFYSWLHNEGRVMLLDASPLAPEIEAVDLVNRLGPEVPMNSELAARIEKEPGLAPAVAAAAITMARERIESVIALRSQASKWLDLDGVERTPELARRALAHVVHAMALTNVPDILAFSVLAEARYRTGEFSKALEALHTAEAQTDHFPTHNPGLRAKIQAYIAMSEARLGHREKAEAALASYRRLWADANPKTATPPPLMNEVQKTISEAFKTTATTP